MSRPTMTARHETPAIYERRMCSPADELLMPTVTLEVTYPQGDTQAALAALDRAYTDVKRQITGMTTLVPGNHVED